MRVKLVSDSAANRPLGLEAASAPLKITVGERDFVDDGTLNVGEMLGTLRAYKGKASSSCPSVQDWLDTFGDAEAVFGVSITSGLSGSYNAAQLAAQTYRQSHPGAKVFILDSLSAGPQLQFLLEKFRSLVEGGMDFDAACAATEAYRAHARTLFCLQSMDNLAKNGRVNPLVAKAIGLLGIRVIGRGNEQGHLEALHKCRGERRALEQIVATMREQGFRGGKVRIDHTLNLAGAQALRDLILRAEPRSEVVISENGGLCSYYAELGGLILAFEG